MVDISTISKRERPGKVSKSGNINLPQEIRDIDLGCIKVKALQDSSPVDWSEDQVDLVEEEYRKFLAMRLQNPDRIVVPDAVVDAFWHFHIIDTEKYAEDCNAIFGEMMHHFPYFGLRGNEDWNNLNQSWRETIDLYKSMFGDPPENMWEVMADCGRLGCAPGPAK